MEHQEYEIKEAVRTILNYLFNNDSSNYIGRAILVIVLCLIVCLILFEGDVKKLPGILRRTFANDLFYPVGVLFIVFFIESFIKYKVKIIDEHWGFFAAITGVVLLYLSIQYFFKKLRNNTVYNIIFIFIIVVVFLTLHREYQFSIYHFCFETLPIFLTFYIYFTGDVYQAHKKQSSEERGFWDEYTKALEGTSTSLIAINTKKYSEFAEPTGYRYFIEQLNRIDELNKIAKTIVRKRFFVVKGKGYSCLKESLEIRSLSKENDLTDEQRTFKSMIKLHTIFNISAYLIPEGEVETIIKELNKLSARKSKKVLNELDRLIINESNFYKPDERKGNLFFKSNDEHKEIINIIIKKYGAEDSNYTVEHIKEIA